jgi:uroporphyrin-III C-methyltransferase/precorrin-2 dehydrogenase/sirohydrochlorin ferrochelatase
MDYFPLFLRLTETPCLIVGGGKLALRKLKLLLRSGARVTVMAPDFIDEITAMAAADPVRLIQSEYSAARLDDYQFIVAATSDRDINHRVAAAAAAMQRFCNVVDDRELSTAIVPAVIDRSPLLIAVSTGGNSPVLAIRLRQQLEQMFAPGLGEVAKFAGERRKAVQKKFTDTEERRHFWQTLLDGPLTEQILQGNLPAAEQIFDAALEGDKTAGGMAWIVGAGPGDPELLTLKAARILRDADVILHDRLVAPAILDMARRDAEFISVGKQAGQPSIDQNDINELLIKLVRKGNIVCRLKGGDPFIFGRGGEEVEALQAAGLPWQVVPGITAASGCAAASNIPLTHRNLARTLMLATASFADGSEPAWQTMTDPQQTIVFYMGVSKIPVICERLIAAGRNAECPAAIIENGCTPRQRVITGKLGTLPELAEKECVVSPALLVVGDVAALALAHQQIENTADQLQPWSPAADI